MSVDDNGLPFGTWKRTLQFRDCPAVLAHRDFVKSAFHRGLERENGDALVPGRLHLRAWNCRSQRQNESWMWSQTALGSADNSLI
jgi:hypothetical protein